MVPIKSTDDHLRCPFCGISFNTLGELESHRVTPEHKIKWVKHWYNSNRSLLASNKNGIEVYYEGDLIDVKYEDLKGTISVMLRAGSKKTFDIVVKNSSEDKAVLLLHVESLHSSQRITLSDKHDVTKNSKYIKILPGVDYAVQCHVDGGEPGVELVPFVFQFKSAEEDALFFIVRTIEVVIVDGIALSSGQQSEYQRPRTKYYWRHEKGTYIPGVPLPRGDGRQKYRLPLYQYRYEQSLRHIAGQNFLPRKVAESEIEETRKLRKMMEQGLTRQTYQMWFKTLLMIEEMQMDVDIQYYNMYEARLKRVPYHLYHKAKCLELEVLGLAENRPSVLRGDSVFATVAGTRQPIYEGVVHQVNAKSLYLAFDPLFVESFIDNMKLNVEFTFNRFPLRVSHRAVELVKTEELYHLLFPTLPAAPPFRPAAIMPFNRKIENNSEQMNAVANIVSGASKPAPYIIFGPPGTGKTVTVVESIKQIYKLNSSNTILAAAPSNAAVDLLAMRLIEHVARHDMIRLHAPSRHPSTIPVEIKDISNVENNCIFIPSDEQLMSYRIIACTFVTAARISSSWFPSDKITHVFLDESGHASEPECLVALVGIVTKECQVVLAGDPFQLGPVVRNPQCFSSGEHFTNNGLDKSYLERLMSMDMYQPNDGKFNNNVATKLLNNYRSHKAILKEPNEMFYNCELKNCADELVVNSLCNWEHLPKRNFPLIFHSVKGKDEQEGNSPSYFNALEVSRVIDYTKKLLKSRNPKVYGKEIGIISPYRRQVEKIRTQLTRANIGQDIKVGSPEEFQGDERKVIIISCVRSSADRLSDDQIFKLGFLRNPKRFNVAVTRAKALLIIIGCPDVLQLDEYWRKLVSFIKSNGGYCGAPMECDLNDIEDILRRFESLDLRPFMGEEGISAVEVAEAPEWRIEC